MRGMDCIIINCKRFQIICVSVPVRGMDCIATLSPTDAELAGFSPREGYGLHPGSQSSSAGCRGRFSPREGYGLHLPGVVKANTIFSFSPREGYGLHPGTMMCLGCTMSFSPREGYGLHRQVCTNRSFVLQHLVQSIFNTIAQFGNDCNVFCVILPTFPVGVCIFLCANPFQCMQDRWANMAVRTKNLQGSLNCLFPVADPML